MSATTVIGEAGEGEGGGTEVPVSDVHGDEDDAVAAAQGLEFMPAVEDDAAADVLGGEFHGAEEVDQEDGVVAEGAAGETPREVGVAVGEVAHVVDAAPAAAWPEPVGGVAGGAGEGVGEAQRDDVGEGGGGADGEPEEHGG